MNALEQEYRDNVERTRVREERKVLALYAIGGVIVVGACIYTTNLLIVLMATPFVLAEAVRRYEMRRLVSVNPPEEKCERAREQLGYRDAPVPMRQKRPAMTKRSLQMAIGLTLMCAALVFLTLNWDHLSNRFVARMVAAVGMLLVIGAQRIHAAWKKRHDAKLMLEWERRLEEMK